ncbi:MAG: hypothetical protein P9L92_08645 [Candidatus Electryonea clarkiae]|nr:hypothetical protein [Candidatus Electryonea clarkiae]MDP8288260.1 hypothetical protein [Candidatus Electryonea clarkiae]
MIIEKFKASVQYNDWRGTSAADSADFGVMEKWLDTNNYKRDEEFLLGISMYVGENLGKHEDTIFVDLIIAAPRDSESVKAMIDSSHGPVDVKKVSFQMGLVEFFCLFKRFGVKFSLFGMLGEREYSYEE